MNKIYEKHPVIAFHPEQLRAILLAIVSTNQEYGNINAEGVVDDILETCDLEREHE